MPDSFQIPSDTPAAYTGLDRLYIGGKWRAGASKPKANLNPYTGETLLEIPQASVADLDDAYAAAKSAQVAWAAKLPSERSKVLAKAAQILQSRREEVIGWLIKESGSTRLKASLEWQSVCGVFLEGSSLPYLVEGRILPADTLGKESRVYRKPVGVVGVISPWNWPLQLSARSVAPALAVGNAVVLKPASDTPITGGLIFAKIFEEAGLPPGVLNVVVGSGAEIGDAFVKHPTPRVISFTGSTKVGRGVARLAIEGPMLKKVDLELGGNSPLIVLDDADLDLAVEAAVFGKFLHNGQICMITNRLIVDAGVYDDFVDAYAAKVKALKVGDPNLSDTFIGPIINQAQFDGVADKISQARASGYREVAGGEPSGLVMPPHVFADVANDSELAQDEIFGPIAPIIRASSEAEALAMANATEYGLSSAVFTRNVDRGVRFAQQIEAGMTHVNDQPVNDLPFNPFGGEKNSGLGRFNGRWVVDAFTTDHWITIQHEPRPYPFDASVLEPGTSSTGG